MGLCPAKIGFTRLVVGKIAIAQTQSIVSPNIQVRLYIF